VQLKAFHKFEDSKAAVAAATALVESKLDKPLSKFLKKHIVKKGLTDKLAVCDAKVGGLIKKKLGIMCESNSAVNELVRGVRSQMSALIQGLEEGHMQQMALSLSHSLSRYKLKFSPDKVDTMVVQAIGLLDDLDKEINTYAMRVKEWYGWHFPEMQKIVLENLQYAQVVLKLGTRKGIAQMDFSDILTDEQVEADLKAAAAISMGVDITEQDLDNVSTLCEQVIALYDYRAQLSDYLKSRMNAIAPNLTVMVGELVGARLIAHAGSLLNLAKQPASTVQILGAEKALFRALKTKSDTPKYGLIYHASLIGQAAPKNKGKISRVLAAKTALAIRVDALSEDADASAGVEMRAKVEDRLRQLEGGASLALSGGAAGRQKNAGAMDVVSPAKSVQYSSASDSTLGKRKAEASPESAKKSKKSKKEKKEKKEKKSKKDKKSKKEKKA
jgi:nucleolar protein 58